MEQDINNEALIREGDNGLALKESRQAGDNKVLWEVSGGGGWGEPMEEAIRDKGCAGRPGRESADSGQGSGPGGGDGQD